MVEDEKGSPKFSFNDGVEGDTAALPMSLPYAVMKVRRIDRRRVNSGRRDHILNPKPGSIPFEYPFCCSFEETRWPWCRVAQCHCTKANTRVHAFVTKKVS